MHHANLLIGKKEWAFEYIPVDCSIETPDRCVRTYERMSIADVRSLIYEVSLRPVADDTRVFVLHIESILSEAQNALLKLFEEPNEHTIFYLVVENEDMLLPTLRSRFLLLAKEEEREVGDTFTVFKKLPYAERLEIIADKLKNEDDIWLKEMVRGLSQYAHELKNPTLIKEVLMLEQYIFTHGASKKMLLEHIALAI